MSWKDALTYPIAILAAAVAVTGAVLLIATQMWRGDALVCADGAVFAKRCSTGHLASGAVVAFDLEKGCPHGWTEHKGARGRFILGVGQHSEHDRYGNEVPRKELRETGGQHQVKLEIEHVPPHAHLNPSAGSGKERDVWALSATRKGAYEGRHRRPTQETGGGRPHTNMPPYVAMYLCEKG